MTTTAAALIMLAIQAAVLALPTTALLVPKAQTPALAISVTLVLGIVFYVANPLAVPAVAEDRLRMADTTAQMSSQCDALFSVISQAGLILDRSDPSRPVVSANLWPRVPSEVRERIETCLEESRRGGDRSRPIQFIER